MTAKFPTFSPADAALLLIDHQTGTMQLIKTIPLEIVKRHTLALAKTAKDPEHARRPDQFAGGEPARTAAA